MTALASDVASFNNAEPDEVIQAMGAALSTYLPDSARTPSFGGTSYWVRGPDSLDADALAEEALRQGIVIEPGSIFFHGPRPPRNYFRLGFSSIKSEKIGEGIKRLADIIDRAQDSAKPAAG